MYKTQKGFTLSEVLITLAIIGVVAALTIPAVVRNYQKQQYYTGFMKAYSVMSQVLSRSIAENGPVATWNIPTSEDNLGVFIDDYFKPYLKIQKECIGASNKECFSDDYKSLDGGYAYKYQPNSCKYKYLLADGFSIAFEYDSLITDGLMYIFIDINGFQKPNRAGKDLFLFTIIPSPGIIAPYALYWKNETSQYMKLNDIKAYCKSDVATTDPVINGVNCGALLLLEHGMNY